MRKTFLVAGVATLALSTATVAHAQTPAPSVDATATVSPTKAGTKSKPKSEKLKLVVKSDRAAKATASKITITFPSSLKLSLSGLTQCTATDDALINDVNVCKSSIAGTGEAHADLNPFSPTPAPLTFKVVPVISKGEMRFVLSGSANAVLHGKISGRKMTIEIPDREPGSQPAAARWHVLVAHRPDGDAVEEEGLEGAGLVQRLQVQEARDRREGRLCRQSEPAGGSLGVGHGRRQVLLESLACT